MILCPICKKGVPDMEIDIHIMEKHPSDDE